MTRDLNIKSDHQAYRTIPEKQASSSKVSASDLEGIARILHRCSSATELCEVHSE